MASPMSFARSRGILLAMLAGTAASWVAPAAAQDAAPPLLASPPAPIARGGGRPGTSRALGQDGATARLADTAERRFAPSEQTVNGEFGGLVPRHWRPSVERPWPNGPEPIRAGPGRSAGAIRRHWAAGHERPIGGSQSASPGLFGPTAGGGSDSGARSTGGGRSLSAAGGGDPTADRPGSGGRQPAPRPGAVQRLLRLR